MKRWISFFGHLAIVVVLTSFGTYTVTNTQKVQLPSELVVSGQSIVDRPSLSQESQDTSMESLVFLDKDFIGFREAVGFKESQGNYNTTNTLGYLGKYQFGAGTLKLLGVHNTKSFLGNPAIQEKVFQLNVERNKWILRRYIKSFVGKKINGIVISESGIIAAAHLAGAGNVKKYLRSYGKTDFSDAYGSNIAYYMKRFSEFDISTIKAVHNPKV